ncbi:response regulator [Catenovulum sediminis]|uniref:Two-component system response regulator n=1 Tax=Catenovulum sediminis TaxID=1740262 RepID=A0ABV1RC58_9ALTE
MLEQQQATILIVDDAPSNIELLSNILRNDGHRVIAAAKGEIALRIAKGVNKPDLILLDVLMPDMDGHEVCRRLKANPHTMNIPIIFATSRNEEEDEQVGFALGAVDYMTKPFRPAVVSARVNTHLHLHYQTRHLQSLVDAKTTEVKNTQFKIIQKLGRAAEFKDNETGEHVIRMSWFARLLAEKNNMDPHFCELLFQAAPMHDIGKIGIPDKILQKPGKLDADEWEIMKKHAVFGADIIGDSKTPLLKLAREIALNHHEKWDGSGYPSGKAGEEIPVSARIIAIADVFDALTSERPYKRAWSEESAIELLQNEAGKHFDPNLVPKFIECLPEIRQIQKKHAEPKS